MELEKLINEDIKQAMIHKDKEKLEALRSIKAALLLEKTGYAFFKRINPAKTSNSFFLSASEK